MKKPRVTPMAQGSSGAIVERRTSIVLDAAAPAQVQINYLGEVPTC
jgi:hypothetical protein